PIVYGYSMTIGPDGRPRVREFGKVKKIGAGDQVISAEREPLADVTATDKDVKESSSYQVQVKRISR
ncbi:MAG: hypothetical protein ACRD5J_04885, partial [Nitrososphaeraceae archaeon]